ncbi:hypothetical protein C5O22_06200 [Treponema sp. J25]|nr:hypothetical protein C5O22_06200 [Treponema sp. J25]
MNMNTKYELVLVDDESRVTEALEREIRHIFGDERFSIKAFNDPLISAKYIADNRDSVFLVISDLRMPAMSGSELLTLVRKASPEIQTILLTAYTDIEDIQKAIMASIQSLLFKPWTRDSLETEIAKAYELWNIRRENTLLASRIDSMLKEAGEFQKRLFASTIPSISELQIEVSFIPFETFHCGGDFFEFRRLDDNNFFVILGDVAGHGLKSAMMAVMLKTAMDELIALEPGLPETPDLFLSSLNNYYCQLLRNEPEVLIDLVAVTISIEKKRLSVANAGMPSVIYVHQALPEFLSGGNPMLGAFIDAPFTQVEREFVPGDRLFLFTDGLIESVPHFFTMKGPEVISTLQTMPEQPIEDIVATFRSALPGGCFTDDVTLMSILFLPEASHG